MTERSSSSDTRSLLWNRWLEVDRIFEDALDLPANQRDAFVRAECEDDAELGSLIADLLEIADYDNARLKRPGGALLRAALGECTGERGESCRHPRGAVR